MYAVVQAYDALGNPKLCGGDAATFACEIHACAGPGVVLQVIIILYAYFRPNLDSWCRQELDTEKYAYSLPYVASLTCIISII